MAKLVIISCLVLADMDQASPLGYENSRTVCISSHVNVSA